MECGRITRVIIAVFLKSKEFADILSVAKPDIQSAIRCKAEIIGILESFIPQEILQAFDENQRAYKFLFGEQAVNLRQKYLAGEIVSLSLEQQRIAKKDNYTQIVVIPDMGREELIDLVNRRYAETFNSRNGVGVFLSNQAQKDLPRSRAQNDWHYRPKSFYMLAVRPDLEVDQAHPTTIGQFYSNMESILQDYREKNDQLFGLDITEYLILEVLTYQKTGHHIDNAHYTALLEEKITLSDRRLNVKWDEGSQHIEIASASRGYGARFGIVGNKVMRKK